MEKEKLLNEDMDAKRWTDEFMARHQSQGLDWGDMIAWFSNAIMCGSDVTRWKYEKEIKALTSTIDQFSRASGQWRLAEKNVSDAYLRIREKLGAWNTLHAPTPEQIYELTESKLDALIANVAELQGENEEQARLLGISGSNEAALLAERDFYLNLAAKWMQRAQMETGEGIDLGFNYYKKMAQELREMAKEKL